MIRTRAATYLLLFLALTQCSDATAPSREPVDAGPNLAKFDSVMTAFMETHNIGAGALGVMKNGVVVYDKGFGWQNAARTTKIADSVMMRLASVSKPITAAAIHHLVSAGQLSLDAKVFNVGQPGGGLLQLQPFPSLGDTRIGEITVRQLLQHRGGWDRDIVGDLTYREVQIAAALEVTTPPSREETVRYILGQPLQFAPGAAYAYSNIGYLVLGLIVEKVAGTDYMSFVHQTIFDPLGVPRRDVIQGRTFPDDRDPREPWYDSDAMVVNVFDPDGPHVRSPDGGWNHEARIAQGGLVTTARALLHLASAYQVAGDDIGTRRTGAEGTGWRWNHGGSLPGTNTLIRQRRSDNVNYVVLFNRAPSSGASYSVLVRTGIDSLLDSGTLRWP